MYRVTKQFSFEAGHRLENHPSKCFNVHGHSYKLFVTLESEYVSEADDNEGMLMDFNVLSKIVNPIVEEYDHSYIYDVNTKDNITNDIVSVLEKHGLKTTKFWGRVTAENMSKYFASVIGNELYKLGYVGITVHIKLYETEKCCAEYISRS